MPLGTTRTCGTGPWLHMFWLRINFTLIYKSKTCIKKNIILIFSYYLWGEDFMSGSFSLCLSTLAVTFNVFIYLWELCRGVLFLCTSQSSLSIQTPSVPTFELKLSSLATATIISIIIICAYTHTCKTHWVFLVLLVSEHWTFKQVFKFCNKICFIRPLLSEP